MPFNLQNFSVTVGANRNVSIPRMIISCDITDPQTDAVIQSLTGANAIEFPLVLSTLTAADLEELLRTILIWLIQKKTGRS